MPTNQTLILIFAILKKKYLEQHYGKHYAYAKKDADELRGNREADQRICFRYTDSVIPLLSKSQISSL